MQMLYNSDAFTVVEIEVPALASASPAAADGASDAAPGHARGGFEIVDKLAQTDIFLMGDIARGFREGVEALSKDEASSDQVDEFISRYTGLPQQPLVLH
jgi:hypothetical protein